jgi:hypothetical protein
MMYVPRTYIYAYKVEWRIFTYILHTEHAAASYVDVRKNSPSTPDKCLESFRPQSRTMLKIDLANLATMHPRCMLTDRSTVQGSDFLRVLRLFCGSIPCSIWK